MQVQTVFEEQHKIIFLEDYWHVNVRMEKYMQQEHNWIHDPSYDNAILAFHRNYSHLVFCSIFWHWEK